MNSSKKGGNTGIIIILVIAIIIGLVSCGGSGGHAPGYGNTSKCTICGKAATHKTSNYGYCTKHWQQAIGR